MPFFIFAAMPTCVCSPLPATPGIGFAWKETSRPFIRKISLTMMRAKSSLSAVCTPLENFQSTSSCSITCVIWPAPSIWPLTPPHSLWPISGSKPYSSKVWIVCSKAVRTLPRVRCQYCSCIIWEEESASSGASSRGVLTQNSSSVALVKTIFSISAGFTCSRPAITGCLANNAIISFST